MRSRGMERILNLFFVGMVRPYWDVVGQLRWNTCENYGPFGAFFLSLLKLDRGSEDTSDMATLKKKKHA